MFEQSTLPPASKRFWATSAGAVLEGVLLVFAIIAPMLWPQVLPRTNLITSLLPPVPMGRPKPQVDTTRAPQSPRPKPNYHDAVFYQPVSFLDHAPVIIDPPADVDRGPWVAGGSPNGTPGAPPNPILDQILRAGTAPAPAPRAVDTPRPAAAAPTVEPKRVRVGGLVRMAQIVHRVEPQYPGIAKQMRVQGDVQLAAVIGIDGRLKELRLVSGHPLLARAAIDAVSQWIYSPTTLNGEPVEVIAPITVTFHLN